MRYDAGLVRFLFWWIAVVLFLALVNAVASWFGLDVASASEEDSGNDHASAGHAAAAPAAPPHAPVTSSHH